MAINAALTSISWAATAIPAVGSVSLNISRPALDITPIGTPTQAFIAGVAGATATLDLFFDLDDAEHLTMLTDINTATAASAVELTTESGKTISGTAFVTGYEVTAQAQGVLRATINLQFTTTPGASATPVTVSTGS